MFAELGDARKEACLDCPYKKGVGLIKRWG